MKTVSLLHLSSSQILRYFTEHYCLQMFKEISITLPCTYSSITGTIIKIWACLQIMTHFFVLTSSQNFLPIVLSHKEASVFTFSFIDLSDGRWSLALSFIILFYAVVSLTGSRAIVPSVLNRIFERLMRFRDGSHWGCIVSISTTNEVESEAVYGRYIRDPKGQANICHISPKWTPSEGSKGVITPHIFKSYILLSVLVCFAPVQAMFTSPPSSLLCLSPMQVWE